MISPELKTLAQYMTGEFDNQEQALADPAWYVHLKLWQVPVQLFSEDSITFFCRTSQYRIFKSTLPPSLNPTATTARDQSTVLYAQKSLGG